MKRRKIDDPPEKDNETLDMFAVPDPVGAARERERVLNSMESTRHTMIVQLRNHAAAVCRATGQPVSTNDVRGLLREMGYTGDGRILGAVFRGPAWKIVGETRNDMKHNHATPIRLFTLVDP